MRGSKSFLSVIVVTLIGFGCAGSVGSKKDDSGDSKEAAETNTATGSSSSGGGETTSTTNEKGETVSSVSTTTESAVQVDESTQIVVAANSSSEAFKMTTSTSSTPSWSPDSSIDLESVAESITVNSEKTDGSPLAESDLTEPVTVNVNTNISSDATVKIYKVEGMGTGSETITEVPASDITITSTGDQTNISFKTKDLNATYVIATIDTSDLTVTVNVHGDVSDPSYDAVKFSVVFSQAITASELTTSDFTIGGTGTAYNWSITDSGDATTFTLTAAGQSVNGTITASLAANAVTTPSGKSNLASTSTDNEINFQGMLGAIERVYPNANAVDSTMWNYYVDASTTTSDCTAGTACIHAGSKRKVTVTGENSCTDLSAVDSLGVFNWSCDDGGGTAVFTSDGFNNGKGLGDLITATAWRPMAVIVTTGSGNRSTPASSSIWGNTVEALPAAATVQTLTDADKIYTFEGAATPNGYNIEAHRVSIVVLPGSTMKYGDLATSNCNNVDGDTLSPNRRCLVSVGEVVNNDNYDFAWFEGSFDGSAAANSVHHVIFSPRSLNSRYHNVDVTGGIDPGIKLYVSNYTSMTDVSVHDTGDLTSDHAIDVGYSTYVSATDITVYNNTGYGFSASGGGVNFLTLKNVVSYGNGDSGIVIKGADGNFENLYAYNNGQEGLHIDGGSSARNVVKNSVFTNNSTYGVNITGPDNTLINATISQNNLHGIINLNYNDNKFFGLISSHNDGAGYYSQSADRAIIYNATFVGNGGAGIFQNATDGPLYVNVVSSNNDNNGIGHTGTTSMVSHTYFNISVTDNAGYGLNFFKHTTTTSPGTQFLGDLLVGSNSTGDCYITDGGVGSINLDTVISGGYACTTSDGNLTITNSQSVSSSFKGLLTSGDSANADNAQIDAGNGLYSFDSITDWTTFSSVYRTWGKGLNTAPMDSTNRGACVTSENCGAWDWSLVNNDSTIFNRYTSCPTGNDTISHDWGNSTNSDLLKNAVEIIGDGVGDDDGLCESSEDCLLIHNIGAYQGHGNVVASSSGPTGCADIGAGGTITNVNLFEYEFNGYAP